MLVNTQYFKEAAIDFKKNKNRYTTAPEGSREWEEYWEEQDRRCNEGYSVGDVSIPGRYYYYLNFTPILRIPDKALKERNKISAQVDAIQDFPNFWEVQYNWWWAKQIALKGISVEDYKILNLRGLKIKEDSLRGGKHLSCLKTRGCGFSYMEAADGTFNYNFIPGSKSFYFASDQGYLNKDGILTKAWDNLEWLNNNTDNWWRKNRHKKDTDLHKRASYLDKEKNERGYKSEIMGIIVDDPNKVRGKRGVKLSFEEGGSFPKLKAALEMAIPLVEQGGFVRGQISVFGTGGEEGEGIEGLEEVFSKPEVYNMMEFYNIWEGEQLEGTTCGFFVPCTMATDKYIDEDGNADEVLSRDFWEAERTKKKKSSDPKALDRLIAERPFTPSEALQRVNSNIFNISEAKKQLGRVRTNRDIQGLLQHGKLVNTEKGVEFRIDSDVKPIIKFPHKNTDNLEGCVTVVERPYRDQNGFVPDNLYILTVDPFYKDDAEDRTSLGSVRIRMRNNNLTGTRGNRTVAWYTGRPVLETFHKIVFQLAELYNCSVQSEIGGGGQGLIDYARTKRLFHKLEYEPEMIHNREIASSQKNKAYFMNMNKERKKLGLKYYADFLMQPIGIRADGEMEYEINREYDEGLLLEIMKFNDRDNFDRISCEILQMFMIKEKEAIEVEVRARENSIFNRPLFTDYAVGDDVDWNALGINPKDL